MEARRLGTSAVIQVYTDPREDTITRVSRASYACRAVARSDHNGRCVHRCRVGRGAHASNHATTRIWHHVHAPTTRAWGRKSGMRLKRGLRVRPVPEAIGRRGAAVARRGRAVHRRVRKVRAGRAGGTSCGLTVALNRGGYLSLDGQHRHRARCARRCGDVVPVELHASARSTCVDGH